MKLIWNEIVEGRHFRWVSYGVRFHNFWIGIQFMEIIP